MNIVYSKNLRLILFIICLEKGSEYVRNYGYQSELWNQSSVG